MVRSPSSSAGATVRSRIACPSPKGGITRYVSSAREQKSSTARGCFRWHNPRVEAGALLFMPASRPYEQPRRHSRRLGVPLFERNRTGARPTLAGELANGFLSDLLGAYHRQF